jgi:peptidyl-prolyl cis-trans isomerase-like 4
VQRGYIAQTGDPTGCGNGGESIWGILEGNSKSYFSSEVDALRKHNRKGLISMVSAAVDSVTGNAVLGSQFIFTLANHTDYLDGKSCIFGEVVEGLEVLDKINEIFTDEHGKPLQDIR